MPHAKCPKCSQVQHLSIAIPYEEWLCDHSPGTKPGEMPEVLCRSCWPMSLLRNTVIFDADPPGPACDPSEGEVVA